MKGFLQKDSLRALSLAIGLLVLPSVAQADWVRYDGKNADLQSDVLYAGQIIFKAGQVEIGDRFDLGEGVRVDFTQFSINISNGTSSNKMRMTEGKMGQTHVGFEDWNDNDFNDVNITFAETFADTENELILNPEGNKLIQNPEPATIVLFGSGLLGLGAWRLRKKQA